MGGRLGNSKTQSTIGFFYILSLNGKGLVKRCKHSDLFWQYYGNNQLTLGDQIDRA